MDEGQNVDLLERFIVAVGGGIGGMILALFAYWRRLLTKIDHDKACKMTDVMERLDGAVTKDELAEALKASAKETDLKLEAITKSVENVDEKIGSTNKALSEALTQTRKDLSGKLNLVVGLLTGKQITDDV